MNTYTIYLPGDREIEIRAAKVDQSFTDDPNKSVLTFSDFEGGVVATFRYECVLGWTQGN